MNPSVGVKERVRPYYLKWLYFRLGEENRPASFSRCWQFPSVDLGRSSQSRGREGEVIFLPMADWHGCMQRSQHLAQGLARSGYRCIYLNPHLGREFPRPYPFSDPEIVTQVSDGVFELHVHLPNEPVFHHRKLTEKEVNRAADSILSVLKTMRSESQTIIVSFPVWLEVAQQLKRRTGATVIYDCHDLISGFGNIDEEILRDERQLFLLADTVLFSSDWLKQHYESLMPGLESKAVLLRNACTPADFETCGSKAPRRAGEDPTIGYVGSLNFWFDADTVALAASRHPSWQFKLVGWAVSPNIKQLCKFANVDLAGEVPYQELSRYLKVFDVATIPFEVRDLTLATNPVKMYEYFACGMPIVSTRLPEVEQYRDLIYMAETSEEWVRQLEVAVEDTDEERRVLRRSVAARETWARRCEVLCEHIPAKRVCGAAGIGPDLPFSPLPTSAL